MTWKALMLLCLFASVTRSVGGCCGGYKFLQPLRRPEYLPMYETQPPCEPIFENQDSFYDNGLMPMYDPVAKFEDPLDRYLANYFESKPIRTKPYCSKHHSPSSRMMSSPPKYYKRGYGNEALVETIPMRGPIPCGSCGGCGHCGQFGCGPHEGCRPFPPCHASCDMPPHVFRHSPQRVLPSMTMPPSCIC